MIANLHAIRKTRKQPRSFVRLILNTDLDGNLYIDVGSESSPYTHILSLHLPPDSAAALRNVLLDKLPIRRSLRDLLTLADPIE